ncbi:MAG: adenylate/guanylate cyclase domain-containing protein [Geminicoccaceae bacterium]
MQAVRRRLAAILAADVVGYSRMMGADEAGTLAALRTRRVDMIEPALAAQGGRIVKLMGDGLLAEFASAVAATECAVAIQAAMAAANEGLPDERRIVLRIGLHVGDVIVEEDDLYGDGVNIAARLEGAAPPGGIVLSEDAWRQVQGKVAAGFAELGALSLKNIERPVRAFRITAEGEAAAPTLAAAAAGEQPSIAVLPFDSMGGDPDQEAFCDGLVEDLITTLSKLAQLRVIARNSTFTYKGRAVDVREVARALGVRYVLEGSVRRGGSRLRITAQLIDARDGTHVWAERFDRTPDDIFAIQDELTLLVATELQVKLTEGEQARLRHTGIDDVAAWTLWAKGLAHYRQAVTRDSMTAARDAWERALRLAPDSAVLHAMLGFIAVLGARFGWWEERPVALARARAHAERALALDPSSPDAHTTQSLVLLAEQRWDEAVAAARRAVALAPGSADAAELASFVLTPAGFAAEAAELSRKAMALSPQYPPAYLGTLGDALRQAGRPDEALAAFTAYHARRPGFGLTDIVLIHAAAGRPEQAAAVARELLQLRPQFTVAGWRRTQLRRDAAAIEADAGLLLAAGLPG